MPSNTIKAITVDQSDAGRLAVRSRNLAPVAPGEITIRVTAISLNRGETKRALTITETGTCPGWDFAGSVEETRGVPGAPDVGTRVVGILPIGSWAERVHAPLSSIAVIPEGVTDAQAACLPVAGLTALHALRKGGLLLGRKVLVDGVSGGVGNFAIQLAAGSGARVYSHIRRPEQRPLVEASSTGGIVVGETLEAARPSGPFDLIVDSVGGSALSAAMTMLRRNGVCVTVGASESEQVSFDCTAFFRASGTSLLGMITGDDIAATEPAADGLAVLLRLVKQGVLKPSIGIEAPWIEIAKVARQLIDRGFAGKAVLHLPL
ncbi:MAG: zinc-binding dehydrogenase [Candidatus Binataceae bacterium]